MVALKGEAALRYDALSPNCGRRNVNKDRARVRGGGKALNVLGLSFVRNAEDRLQAILDSMATYCDSICVVDDRSSDRTGEILRSHPRVSNVFTIDPQISNDPWHFPESWLLQLLYRMADFYQPDWVVMLSADEHLEPVELVRETLLHAADETAGIQTYLTSTWSDPLYPFMVPLMGQARSLVGRIWRYHPGLESGRKRLHNSYFPGNVSDFGQIVYSNELTIAHFGWSTLAERIAKVDLYTALDPKLELNDGVPYDLGLLFGYERHRTDELIREYGRRLEQIRATEHRELLREH